jgi:hypothetical protein
LLLQTLLQLRGILEEIIQHLSEGGCKRWVESRTCQVIMPAHTCMHCQQQQQQQQQQACGLQQSIQKVQATHSNRNINGTTFWSHLLLLEQCMPVPYGRTWVLVLDSTISFCLRNRQQQSASSAIQQGFAPANKSPTRLRKA